MPQKPRVHSSRLCLRWEYDPNRCRYSPAFAVALVLKNLSPDGNDIGSKFWRCEIPPWGSGGTPHLYVYHRRVDGNWDQPSREEVPLPRFADAKARTHSGLLRAITCSMRLLGIKIASTLQGTSFYMEPFQRQYSRP